MPIYEYKCRNCGKIEELLVLNTKTVTTKLCGNCSGICDKIVSEPGGFSFKGSGFYKTDYKDKNK